LIPKECKRLAEVDFPIAVVSKHAAREKSIRHGHPSTLHLWWARRPLASSRAVLLALLLPDPCDDHCPADFKKAARALLPQVGCGQGKTDEALRQGLLKFIGDFANWDYASHPAYLDVARGLVKAAHPEETPLVVDPFAGGGSIPLEALRLGCDAFASDLNPVACLILKVMLEDIPRRGPGLADELRKAGAEIKRQAEKELAEFYPPDPDGARPIAYLWARTVRCEAPDCGAEIPLVRSFWLSKKASRRRALQPKVVRPRGGAPFVEFALFEPGSDKDVPAGTVKNAKATCVCCGRTLSADRLQAQLTLQRGGPDTDLDDQGHRQGGASLVAVALLRDGEVGRSYRLPTDRDYRIVRLAQEKLRTLAAGSIGAGQLTITPEELINPIRPSPNARGMSAVTRYGMTRFGDLFTARQKLGLSTLARLVRELPESKSDIAEVLALAVSRVSDIYNAGCRWESSKTQVRNLFTRQAIPMCRVPGD
jgi:adenine-specific DNA methylase